MWRGKRFQIDTLLITAKNLYIYEVKNLAGEYYYENEKMYFGRTKKEVFDSTLSTSIMRSRHCDNY